MELTKAKELLLTAIRKKIFQYNKEGIQEFTFIRKAISINELDLLSWLYSQKSDLNKFYWNDKIGDLEVAGICIADQYTDRFIDENKLSNSLEYLHKKIISAPDGIRYYGGMNFCKDYSSEKKWQPFGRYNFIAPEFELINMKGKYTLACNFLYSPKQNISSQLAKFNNEFDTIKWNSTRSNNQSIFNRTVRTNYIPDKEKWNNIINNVLNSIKKNTVDKIVVSRVVQIIKKNEIDIQKIIHNLTISNPKTVIFAFQPEKFMTFTGASPELLYSRENDCIKAQAIAGTRIRGKNNKTDCLLGKELLTSQKELSEHKYVLQYVENSLKKLCSNITDKQKQKILKLSTLQHLCSNFEGKLNKQITDNMILSELHPTPATGGCPTERALEMIHKYEPFERGWYSAPIGWLSKDSAKFVVAIRSALINQKSISIYAGSGIVEKSTPDNEWQETEDKINNFLKSLV
ncbi:MAG TPA: isochorismate synthase [Victivallales bacterium]|nr:isochorismate synthase [Victivallales bacterium]